MTAAPFSIYARVCWNQGSDTANKSKNVKEMESSVIIRFLFFFFWGEAIIIRLVSIVDAEEGKTQQ